MRSAWLWISLVLAAAPGAGAEAELDRPLAVADGRHVLVSLHLRDAFDEQLTARIQSGLPTGFVYEVELMRDRKRWWDEELRSTTIEVVAMYNAMAQEYLVNIKRNGKLVESRLASSLEELRAAMTRLDRVPALSLEGLPTGLRVLVRARVLLGSRTLLNFIPTRIATDWEQSRKFRVP